MGDEILGGGREREGEDMKVLNCKRQRVCTEDGVGRERRQERGQGEREGREGRARGKEELGEGEREGREGEREGREGRERGEGGREGREGRE